MKKYCLFLLMISACLLMAAGVFAQTDEMTLIGSIDSESPVSRMVWDETGEWLTMVSRDQYQQFPVGPDKTGQADGGSFDFGTKAYTLTTVGGSGVMAALSGDWRTIYVYDEPSNPEKAVKTIEPGFMMLSVSVSDDGSMVLADSAEEIRTVVYNTADGEQIYDLGGFSTAAPVYDSVLSRDGSHVIWHSRGTFAVQDAVTGNIGETVSLWDFASSYDLAPDNSMLAVGIINDDYESGAVLFFDPQTGAEAGRTLFGKTGPQELSYNASGSVLMAADRGTLYRIDPQSFELLGQVTIVPADSGDVRISRIAPSPDGTSCAVLLSDGKAFIVK
ncbi:MAG: WD40 repeat domain-containing protein [Flexilinea sp.]|nr:WD40 repeat domain-containing protein [Flexilinea sp.]